MALDEKQPSVSLPDADAVSRVAHSLRTPLTVIMSTVSNFLDGAFGPLSDDQRRWIKKLETHAAALETITSDLLALMRDESARPAQAPAPAAPVTRLAAWPVVAAGRPPLVLVVDDEPDIRDVVRDGLALKGVETMCASTAAEALDAALARTPDVVLMDVLLRDGNGVEACATLKERVGGFLPVIFITGQNDLREKMNGAPSEADDLLTKPFQLDELYARVRSMLTLRRLHDELQAARRKAA